MLISACPRPTASAIPVRRPAPGAALVAGAGAVGAAGLAALDVTVSDKFKHGGICFAATVGLGRLGLKPELAAGAVFAGATIGKEVVLDRLLGLGNPSLFDASANLAGCLAGYATLKLID
ncbi:MAG: hypothetical protein AB7S38_24510 [Vulcanimicrobiota bacterium]